VARARGTRTQRNFVRVLFVPVEDVREGHRFVMTADLVKQGLWGKPPVAGEFQTVIPAGTVLVVQHDRNPRARGFACKPERYHELEAVLVPEVTRRADRYGGYYFVLRDHRQRSPAPCAAVTLHRR
jgi:hypothetical protein